MACQVTGLRMETKDSEILYTYRLERADGVKSAFYGNRKISGLSLPALIKERNGNCLRVHFSLDQEYQPGNHVYFTFAIETTSWYCLPEEGSTVHIYFQNWDETSGIAIHAMRMSGDGRPSKSVSAQGAVSDKSFSTTDGKAMKFTESGIEFVSDAGKASHIALSKNGDLNLSGTNIVIGAQCELTIGGGDEPPHELMIQSLAGAGPLAMGIVNIAGEAVDLATDKGIVFTEDGEVQLIAAGTLSYAGEQKDPPGVQYSDEKLKEEDKKQRDEHNKEVFEARERESKGKMGVGAAVAAVGVCVLIAAATVVTAGAAAVAVATVAGCVSLYTGASLYQEGASDLAKMESGDFSQSYNMFRDEFCGGDDGVFQAIMFGSVMIGVSVVLAPVAAKLIPFLMDKVAGTAAAQMLGPGLTKFALGSAAQMVTTGAVSTGIMFMGDISDGYVDGQLGQYLQNFGQTAAIAFLGYAAGTGALAAANKLPVVNHVLSKAGKFAPALIIGGETFIDVGVDYASSLAFGTKFNAAYSVLSNLSANILFSIDPVNMATGGFCLAATDLSLPDLTDERFRMERFYNSVVSCKGVMGKGWMFSLESCIYLREDETVADVVCADGHMERFCFVEGLYQNRRQGDLRYQLQKLPGEEGFLLTYVPERKQYHYDCMGRLLSVKGKGDGCLTVQYQEAHISKVITSAGYVLDFLYQDDRIVEIRDESGRAVRYKYEDGYLTAVCHVDEGVTTYHYDKGHHISQVIDQNGHAYVRNEYDESGRVVAQYYLDGTRSTIEYYPEKRENVVSIEGLGRRERYCYNKDFLITHSYADDGTVTEYGYDQWTNRTYEKDRNGNAVNKTYNVYGKVVKEELPSGQVWEYEYDQDQNLVFQKANSGEEYQYHYNSAGFLTEEGRKIRDGVWRRRFYERDAYGRILKETDSRGNSISYAYQTADGHILPSPTQITDALGQKTSYEYDTAGRNIAVTTESGTVELRYNKQNYVTYFCDGKGNETRRTYDKMGNLTALFPPNQGRGGQAWMYRYDFFDRLTEVRDPLGGIWKKERNLAGAVTREIHPCGYGEAGEEGYGIRYEYDSDSRKIRTIYPDGSVERCFYDGNGNLVKKVRPEDYDSRRDDGTGVSYQYDSMNRLKQIRDEEGVIRKAFVYDRSGNLAEERDSSGGSTYHAYDLLGNCTATWTPVEETGEGILYSVTLYEYDTESNKIRERRGLDKVFRGQEPKRCHELFFTYDSRNRLTTVKDRYGAKAAFRYNSRNQKIYESFRISRDVKKVIRYEYDAAGNLAERREGVEERFLKAGGSRKVVWAITSYEYDGNGNCIRSTSPKGYQRAWSYDALNRVVREEARDKEGGIRRRYRYRYDAAGNLLSRTDESREGQAGQRLYRYDQKDRMTHLTDEGGGTTRLVYDKNDRIIKVIRPEQYREGPDDGAGISYAYNCRDQILSVTGPDGAPVRECAYGCGGSLQSVWEGGVYREYAYNLAGQPLAVYTGRKNAEEKQASRTFTYDAQGNITGTGDGNRNQTGFVLDDWGRITEIHTPEGGVERYTYDYAGNITSTTDAKGGTITYRYNSFGQVSEILDQEDAGEYFYYDEEGRPELHIDRNGNQVRTRYNMDNRLLYQRGEDAKGRNGVTNQYAYYPDGRLKEAAGGGITYRYDYTAAGWLKSKSGCGKTLLEYAYDRNGNITERKDLTGAVTRYAYDSRDRLLRVGAAEGDQLLAAYDYTAGDRVRSLSYGNGVTTTYDYAADGQVKSLVSVTSDGRVLLDYQYAYDGNGNRVAKSGENYRVEYAYDKMNRLTEAVYNGEKERYRYDLAGNRLKKESGGREEIYHYNRKNQLVRLEQETGPVCYAYDRQGNMISEESGAESRRYGYDAWNRQEQVSVGGLTRSCRYDGENLRYETEENGSTVRFLFDRGELAAEETEGRQKSYRRGYQVVCREEQGKACYYLQDERQSTVLILDEEQNVKKSYRYDAFGGIIGESGSLENRITYTGQMYDGATGQYYLRARFYNPAIGRFLQEDTYRGDGLNLYAYCRNNPVMYYDPSGFFALCSGGKTSAGEEGAGKLNDIPQSKLQHEFKHAGDFGVTGNWNNANGELFSNTIKNHINNVTNPIQGTYRGTINVTHYYDPVTGVNAMVDSAGNFVGGWKLSPQQITNLLKNGNIQ